MAETDMSEEELQRLKDIKEMIEEEAKNNSVSFDEMVSILFGTYDRPD